MSRVLVVDDDAAVSFALERFLKGEGHEVWVAPDAERGIALARDQAFDLVLLDLHLPGMSGQAALPVLRAKAPVLVLTAHGSAETAMDALAAGAFDHLTKPVELAELRRVVARALAPPPARTIVPAPASGTALVGRSRSMLEVGKRIGILARSDASVLVLGESGTGKEHVARAIHERSPRASAPFAPVACAALPEQLLEAELFGSAKGAFTGAVRDRPGKIEAAKGGTLFLDEVGEVSLAGQVKLLRFLEERVVERLGEDGRRPVDLRVIAATNADLEERVRAGRFREDLYYRLNVVTIELPPLRERREDIPLLVEHFLARAGGTGLLPEALERLVAGSWPGNVRELRNAVEHAVALARGAPIDPTHLPAPMALNAGTGSTDALFAVVGKLVSQRAGESGLHESLVRALERAAVAKALELTNGNQVAAAKLLDMNRSTFRKRMEEHGLNP
jgi:two-component system NtrC family response regulator/two-component system nitrogen regulation response regulator GlnG